MRRNPDGTFMILNPSKPKKRRKRAKAKKSGKRRARARHNPNPAPAKRRRRRRSSSSSAPKRRRHYRRNPSRRGGSNVGSLASPLPLPKIGQFDLGFAVVTGVGAIGHGMLTNLAAQHVPVAELKTGPGKFALGFVIATAGSWLAWKFAPRKWAVPLIAGMGSSVTVQAFNTFIVPNFPQLPVSGYENVDALHGYQDGNDLSGLELAGDDEDRFASPY